VSSASELDATRSNAEAAVTDSVRASNGWREPRKSCYRYAGRKSLSPTHVRGRIRACSTSRRTRVPWGGGRTNSTIPNKKLTSPPVRPFAIRGGRVISLEETNGKTTYRKPRTARTRRRLVRIARGTTRSYTPRDYREILVFRTSRIIIIIIINTRAVSADTVNARAPDIICTRGTGRVLLRDTVFRNNVLPSANDVIF